MPKYRLKKVAGRNYWHLVWTEEGQTKRASTGTEDRAEAEAFLEDFKEEQPGYKKPENMTVGEITEAYIKDREPDIKLPEHLWSRYKAISPRMRRMMPRHLSRDACNEHIEKRQKQGCAPSTIRDELALVKAALRHAQRENWVSQIPHIKLPPSSPPRDRFLSKEEARRLIRASRGYHQKLFITLALATGARSGAILDLEWDRVDLEKRRIDFNVPGMPITKKRRATVPVNPELYRALADARERATTDFVIEYGGHKCKAIRSGFKNAAKRAGLDDVSPHTLRHTAATWMAGKGVSMRNIAGMLGHKNSLTTESVYAKHSPDFLEDAANALILNPRKRLKKRRK